MGISTERWVWRLLAVATLIAPVRSAVAQPVTLRVHVVRDSAGGASLDAAVVRVAALVSQTGMDGIATLRVPPGATTVFVARIGFRPDSLSFSLSADTLVTLALLEQASAIERVTVSATRTDRRVEDTPLRVEVVDEEEVSEKTSMRPGSIVMLLAETGGLRVQTNSGSLGSAAVRVQGLRGRYTLLLADGLPLYGDAGGLGMLQVPPVDLAHVEVIKGTASALYGSAALGGVINLVSRRASDERERQLIVNQTSRDGTDLVFFTADPLAHGWSSTLLAGAHRQRRQDVDGDAWTDVPGYERVVVRPRLHFGNEEGRTAFVTAGFTAENRVGGTLGNLNAPDGAPYDERLRTRRADAGVQGRMTVKEGPLKGGIVSVRGSAMEQQHEHVFGAVHEDDRHRTWFAEATMALPTEHVLPLVGVAFQHESYRATQLSSFNYDYAIPALFAQADVDATRRLTLSANVRVDAHSAYGTFVNPRVSALVKGPLEGAGAGWTLRASAGTGAFAPTPFNETTDVTGLSPLAPIDGLKAERARSGSVDLGGPLETTLGRVELNASLFGSIIDDAVQVVDATGNTRSGASRIALRNAPEPTRTGGGELLARLTREPFRVTATYTHVRASEWNPAQGTSQATRRAVPLDPRHSAGLVASMEHEGEDRLGIELYYTGSQPLENDPVLASGKPYLIAGLLAEKRFGAVRLSLNAENLTNVRQGRYAPVLLPRRGQGGRWTTDVWAPLDGTVVNAVARLTW
ncbi:MAG: TonB-dependent receptor [Gemmatimonadaceae bacterium]